MNIVALIPARGGSKRIPRKNIKPLGGKPLIQWTIDAAQQSGIFASIVVCSDDDGILASAPHGVSALPQPHPLHRDDCRDIEWVSDALRLLTDYDAFAILRPTSPFRTGADIASAWKWFQMNQPADSLRAVRRAKEHPGKMWMVQRNQRMVPLLPYWTRTGSDATDAPWHSSPTQGLPVVYAQTASLEIAWTGAVRESGTIAGTNVVACVMDGWSGFDINTPDDWDRAEAHARTLLAGV